MRNSGKVALIFAAVATVVSAPLAWMLGQVLKGDLPPPINLLMGIAPVLIGAVAAGWCVVLTAPGARIWRISPVLFGSIIGLLTFLTFVAVFGLGAEFVGGSGFFAAVHTVGLLGFLLFGWIPLVFGAFAGWLGWKLASETEFDNSPLPQGRVSARPVAIFALILVVAGTVFFISRSHREHEIGKTYRVESQAYRCGDEACHYAFQLANTTSERRSYTVRVIAFGASELDGLGGYIMAGVDGAVLIANPGGSLAFRGSIPANGKVVDVRFLVRKK